MQPARELLAGAHRVAVLTGAGISADSGVPTFRGPDGLWRNHRPEELATPEAFRRDPRLVWEWYGERREAVLACEPNPAHHAVAAWLAHEPERRRLITQNVDGLHARAWQASGPAADRPLELHGSLFRVRCVVCGAERPSTEAIDASSPDSLPHCRACGQLERPAVVWFGESLDRDILHRARLACQSADLALVIGTSALVYPAAGLAEETRRAGGQVIEVNPDLTPLSSHTSIVIRERAAVAVPELLA